MWLWRSKSMSDEELAISRAITSLKTLTVVDGCVSISPSEVTSQPGYLQERAAAGALARQRQVNKTVSTTDWAAVDQVGLSTFSLAIAESLTRSRQAGLQLDEAISQLRRELENIE